MACDKCQPGEDCFPCNNQVQTPDPILPRCDIALTDGTFTNATVVIEGGCITSVATGSFPLYDPQICCGGGSGGGGTGPQGPQGPAGPAGSAATVTVGSTTTLAAGASATVSNSGTASAAVLNFGIPRGADGAAGGGGGGLTNFESGIGFTNGLLTELPAAPSPTWPPILRVTTSASPAMDNIGFTATKTGANLMLDLDLTAFRASVLSDVALLIAGLQSQIDSLENRINCLNTAAGNVCP